MVGYIYAVYVLVPVIILHSISATSLPTNELKKILSQYRTKAKVNRGPIVPSLVTAKLDHMLKLADVNAPSRRKTIATKTPSKFKETNKHVVFDVLKPILEKNNEKYTKMREDKTLVNPYLTISASELVQLIMSKKPNLNQTERSKQGFRGLLGKPQKSSKETKLTTANNQNQKPKSRSVRAVNFKSIINKKIDEKDKRKDRDLVLESVSKLIANEKLRQRFDLVNPPNSQFSKRQQLLWERIRIKAAEELLLHPKPLPVRATERIFDNLKMDLEMATREPTEAPGLFKEFKTRVEKDYYLSLTRGRKRVMMSTLKPYY